MPNRDPEKKRVNARRYSQSEKGRRKQREAHNRRTAALRAEVYAAYGNCCSCCGEIEQCFLTIDHLKDNGAEHRREIGNGSQKLYTWLRDNNFPPEFTLRCYNCNSGRYRNGGTCPHEVQLAKSRSASCSASDTDSICLRAHFQCCDPQGNVA